MCDNMYICVEKNKKRQREEIAEFNRKHRQSSTNTAYTRHQTLYKQWCGSNNIDSTTPQVEALGKYLIYCFESKDESKRWSSSTFNTARCAISDLFKFTYNDTISLGEHPMISSTLATIKKMSAPSTQKNPLTKEHFVGIFKHINMKSFRDVRDYHLMLIMYAMARRAKEATSFLMSNITVDEVNGMLLIKHTPAKQKAQKVVDTPISFAPDNIIMDVGRWHRLYMSVAVKESKYYLHKEDGTQMSAQTPRHIFKRLFTLAGFSFESFGSHSARRGGATAMAEAGQDELTIKTHCTWSGETYQRYIKPTNILKAKATMHLNKLD